MPDSEGHGRENDRFCGWCGVMTDHHTAEHEEARVKRSRLPEAHGRDREEETGHMLDGISDDDGTGLIREVQADVLACSVGHTDWQLPEHGAEDVICTVAAALDRVRAQRAEGERDGMVKVECQYCGEWCGHGS